MPRATYVAVLTIGIFYTVTTYLMVEGQGAAGLQEYLGSLQPDPTAFLFALGATYIGPALTTVMSLLFISSVFAALLAFHNAVARYLYALGREGLVPGAARPHAHQAPQPACRIAQPVDLGGGRGLDLRHYSARPGPGTVHLADSARHAGDHRADGLGILRGGGLLRPQSRPRLQRLADHRRTAGRRSGDVGGRVYAASQFGLLIGNPDSPLRWILPALIIVAAVAGVIAAISLKSRSPELYAQMGRHRDIELVG